MLKYENLPVAPSNQEREEMILELRETSHHIDEEIVEAFVTNIRNGYLVIIKDDLMSITKEGYDYYQSIVKASVN
jgi:hypothetical protein